MDIVDFSVWGIQSKFKSPTFSLQAHYNPITVNGQQGLASGSHTATTETTAKNSRHTHQTGRYEK